MAWRARIEVMLLVVAGAPVANAQANAPAATWRLRQARATVGDDIDLHRVRGAVLTRSGRIVIADNGNARLVVATPEGRFERAIGRSGSGPGEFRMLQDLYGFGDTIVTYDGGLRRLTYWLVDGTLLRTAPVPSVSNWFTEVRAAISSDRFLLTALFPRNAPEAGLYSDTVRLAHFQPGSRGSTAIGDFLWTYSYLAPQEGATTWYRTPFLGVGMASYARGVVAVVPLGSTQVEFYRLDGRPSGQVVIPESRRPFDRLLIDRYRDSILGRAKRASDIRSAQRIEAVFGPTFPVPEGRSVVETMRLVGSDLWLRAFALGPGRQATWYVVDAGRQTLRARLSLPADWWVVGGDDRAVLVLHRDEDGVETVAVHDILR